jgi:hypothetical protein
MTDTPALKPTLETAPKKPSAAKPGAAVLGTEPAPSMPTPAAAREAEPLRGTVIDEVTELPMGSVPLLWTVALGGPSSRRPGRIVEIGRGLSESDGSFTIAPMDNEEVREALCQHACMRGVKAWIEVDTRGEGTARKIEVVRGARETLLRVSGNGQELTTDDWREAADFLQSSRLLTVGELVHELSSPGGGSPLAGWRTTKRARALGYVAAVSEQAGHQLPGTALLDLEHQANLDALAEGEIDKAMNQFRSLVDFKRFGGTETDWHIGLFPSRKSDMELYRDYLRGTWVAAAQKMYSASSSPNPAPAAALERQIVGRFHQDFRTSDTASAPAAKLLIPILREALLTAVNRDGFGLAPADIPAQGAQSDDDYLGVLTGLTGKTLNELRNRFRVRFDRALGEQTDPIALNVEALQGLLVDTWQSPEEPFPAEPALWVQQETGKPLIFTPFIGRAPFYLQFEEWQQQTLRFYPENVYNVRRNIPLFDEAFRKAVAGQKAVALRWDVAYNAVAYNGDAYYKNAADWTASGEWIEKLFPIADTLREAMRIADGQDYKQAHEKLNWCADALKTALKDYKLSWTKDKFYWSYSNDVWASQSPLISLKSRSTRSVKNGDELKEFEAWFERQYILEWKGVMDPMESEIRDMQFTHARSLLIYDALYLHHVLLPYLRAGLSLVTGDYATASKLLGRITGYEVGIGETASPAGYLADPKWGKPAMIDGVTLPYSTAVGIDGNYYADLAPAFNEDTYKDKVLLAPFELRFFQLAQGEAMLLLADELYRNDDPSSIRRAREMFKGIIFLHGEDPDIDPHFVLQYQDLPPLGKIDTGNPARAAQLARARLGFYQIEQGLNVYGFRSDMVPVLRYRPLKQAADLFAAGAKSAQTDFLGYMMKFEQAQIEAWQTNALLKKAEASKVIAGEHIEIAKVGVAKAQEQVAQVKAQITAKQQEIADSNSFFSQLSSFFGGMKDSITGMVPLADKVMNDDTPASSVSGDQLKLILTKSLSSTAGGKEAAAAALGSGAALAIGFGAFAYAGYTSMSSMADTIAKRDGDLKSLQNVALPAAEAQVKLKQRDVTIAQQELAIAQADVDLAQALRRFQQDRFLNVDLWNKLASFANQLIRRYLDLAARTGWLAERALAYEQNRDVRIIRMNYYPKALRGLTGADRLQLDLAELEANRLQGVRLTVPIKHTISLAREYPLAFGQLKDKGRCRIRTQEAPLRGAYPGSFGYRIRAVTVAAQDAGGIPPRGMFRNLGVSEVSRDDTLKPNLLLRFPDALPLSEFRLQDDLFVYGLPGETLLQFEGSGFETAWELELPVAPNPQGLRALTDIIITFDMNASYSEALAGKLAALPPGPVARAILLAASVQDSRGLSNLRVGTTAARIRFDPKALPLPAQEKNRKLANLALLAIGKTEKTYDATLKASQAGTQAAFQIKGGLALSNAGDLLAGGVPSPLNSLVGLSLDQPFELVIDRTGVQDELRTLFDIVLYLDYTADL